jgi:hypothetical protein
MESLEAELARLPPEHRAEAMAVLALRERARALASALGCDEGDVFHQLQQLARSPAERLRMGLALGRARPRSAE